MAMFCWARRASGFASIAVLESLAQLQLVGAKLFHAGFEIMRDQPLHRIAIHADQLAQKVDRQHLLAAGLFLHDDLVRIWWVMSAPLLASSTRNSTPSRVIFDR
jgi:hypothetical protein